jgi:hypothetical protein
MEFLVDDDVRCGRVVRDSAGPNGNHQTAQIKIAAGAAALGCSANKNG